MSTPFGLGFFSDCLSSFRGREIGNEKLIAILDLQQIGYRNIDTRGLITGFQFLQVNIVLCKNIVSCPLISSKNILLQHCLSECNVK